MTEPRNGRRRGWRRPFIACLALLAFAVTMLPLASPPAGAEWSAEVATDALNVRAEPGTWADVVAIATWGDWVEVLDGPTDDGWYRVSHGGAVGWVAGEYLAFDGVGGSGERWIDVDRSSQMVTLYQGGAALASFWGAFGWDDSSDGYYATAIGTYYVYDKYADLSWTEYGQAYIASWVGFDPARANGFHSWSMDEWGNVLPGGDGPTGGCVALEPWAAAAVYDFAEIGMRVEVHW